MIIPCLEKYIKYPDQFPRPNWTLITKNIERQIEQSHWDEACYEVSRIWLQKTAHVLGEDYRIHESQNFFLLTDETPWYAEVFLKFLEQALKNIMSSLPGIAQGIPYGKHYDVDANYMRNYQKGREVIVEKRRSKWFHRIRYVFVRYVELSDDIIVIPGNR